MISIAKYNKSFNLKVTVLEKNQHAVALGRLGGLKGGKARAAALSREERRRIARKAAKARWKPIRFSCPFCHKNNSEVEQMDEDAFLVVCNECGGIGPIGIDEDEAVKKWDGYK